MKRKILLLILSATLMFGCNSISESKSSNEYKETIRYEGANDNWKASIEVSYIETLKKLNDKEFEHKYETKDQYKIDYIGPSNKVIRSAKYEFILNSSDRSSGSDTFNEKDKSYTITGAGIGSTSSKVPIQEVGSVKIGSEENGFPNAEDRITLIMNWDGNEENIVLKPK